MGFDAAVLQAACSLQALPHNPLPQPCGEAVNPIEPLRFANHAFKAVAIKIAPEFVCQFVGRDFQVRVPFAFGHGRGDHGRQDFKHADAAVFQLPTQHLRKAVQRGFGGAVNGAGFLGYHRQAR